VAAGETQGDGFGRGDVGLHRKLAVLSQFLSIICSDFDPQNADRPGAFRLSSPVGSNSMLASNHIVSEIRNRRTVGSR